MEENKEKVKVKKNTRKKYNGSKENKQKAATKAKSRTRNTKTKSSKAKTTRPKSELLKEPIEESVKEPIEEPIKDDVKVAVGTAESKESARIEELKSQIEKLLAEKKDAGSISRTKFEEIYNLQSELRNLVLLKRQRQSNEKNNAEPIKDEESKDKSKEPNRIDELKSRIEKLQAEKQSYYEVSGEGESAIVNAERKDASSINRTKIDIEIYKLQSELRDLLTKENEKSEEEPEKGEENKDGKSKEEPENGEENREDPKKDDKKTEEIDSPEVKAVKSKISILDNKINSEEWVLRNNEGNYTPEELAQIKAGIDKLKAQRYELNGKLSNLEKNLKEKDSKGKDDDATKAGEPTKDPSKDDSEGKGKDGEKDGKDSKETTEPEMSTYKIGPFKRLLMKIIRKIKSWAKVDGRIARLCDRAEGAVIGNATPLLEGSAEEKEVKKVLEVGKVKDYEKEIADKENAKYSKDKYEKADDHEEAKKKLAQEDMDFLYEKVKEAYELKKAGKEIPLIGEIVNKEYSKVVDEYADKKSTSFDDKKIEEFSKANDIPEVTKGGAMNLTLWMTSKAIVEMAKEKGIAVNQGKGKNANARPLSEIYASLEARVKTDRVSEEYSKERRTSFGKDEEKSTVKADKPAKSKTEADSKVDKADNDLEK